MQTKSLFLIVFGLLLFSCASKKVVSKPIITDNPRIEKYLAAVKMDGKKIFENNCANCHKLYDPSQFTKQEWMPILERMQMKADLSNEDIAAVREYIFKDLK